MYNSLTSSVDDHQADGFILVNNQNVLELHIDEVLVAWIVNHPNEVRAVTNRLNRTLMEMCHLKSVMSNSWKDMLLLLLLRRYCCEAACSYVVLIVRSVVSCMFMVMADNTNLMGYNRNVFLTLARGGAVADLCDIDLVACWAFGVVGLSTLALTVPLPVAELAADGAGGDLLAISNALGAGAFAAAATAAEAFGRGLSASELASLGQVLQLLCGNRQHLVERFDVEVGILFFFRRFVFV